MDEMAKVLGTWQMDVKAVREKVDAFFIGLTQRVAEVMQRCHRELQALADLLLLSESQTSTETNHVDFSLRSV